MLNFIRVLLLVLIINVAPLFEPILDCIHRNPSQDDVVVSEQRLRALRQALPPRSVVGYMADGEVTKGSLIGLMSCRRFYMTQYALTPNTVVHDPSQPLVVGNFSSAKEAENAVVSHRLHVIRDFGGGVMLLSGHREP